MLALTVATSSLDLACYTHPHPWVHEVITDIVSDYLCESINGVTGAMNVDFLGTIAPRS